jgi:hypothetical protein
MATAAGKASRYGQTPQLREQDMVHERPGRAAASLYRVPPKKKKTRPALRPDGFPNFSWTALLVVHAAHAGHTAWTTRGRFVFFRQLCYQSFGHQQQPRNRSRILQRGSGYLGRVDDTCLH